MPLAQDMFFLDPGFQGSLQYQIRQIVASAILDGRFQPGEKLPSSRKLAEHLGISRITVTLAYHELVADDYIYSNNRSGYFVSPTAPTAPLPKELGQVEHDKVKWDRVIKRRYSDGKSTNKVPNWRQFRYPFMCGQPDPSLFNQTHWRLCALQALGKKEFDSLTSDYGVHDDPELIRFIMRHTLPRRGILARPEQILVTVGAQNAMWIAAQILLDRNSTAAFENPGYHGVREVLRHTGCQMAPIEIDKQGLPPKRLPDDLDVLFTTPSHQCPTMVTMPMNRRRKLLQLAQARDFMIVEDDYEFEMSFLKSPSPALKSLDQNGRVIYVGSFSKSLFPGLRLGFIVGSEPLIEQARALRLAMLRHPPGHIQRTTAYFMGLGHYDAMIKRMRNVFQKRRAVMDQAIGNSAIKIIGKARSGGSNFWVEAPEHIDTEILAQNLLEDGVIIESGAPFFAGDDFPRNFFRLAYSSIQTQHIPAGIDKINQAIAKLS